MFPKAVFSLHRFKLKGNNRNLGDFFRDLRDQLHNPRNPVNKSTTRGIGIVD